MKIKEQWLVLHKTTLQLLILTENNGYYLGFETNRFGFERISPEEAIYLIEYSKPK